MSSPIPPATVAQIAEAKGIPSGWLAVQVTRTEDGVDLTYHYGAYTTAKVSVASTQLRPE